MSPQVILLVNQPPMGPTPKTCCSDCSGLTGAFRLVLRSVRFLHVSASVVRAQHRTSSAPKGSHIRPPTQKRPNRDPRVRESASPRWLATNTPDSRGLNRDPTLGAFGTSSPSPVPVWVRRSVRSWRNEMRRCLLLGGGERITQASSHILSQVFGRV